MTTAEEKKEAFVFYETFIDSIKELEPADQYRFLCAIINYGIYGAEPEFVGLEKALWIQIRNAIDQSKSRRKSAQNNGSKGGRPRTEEPVIGGDFSAAVSEEEEYEDYIEDNEEVIDIDDIEEEAENITERPFENKEEENRKEPNETENNQTKPNETENNQTKPNETENNPTKPNETENNQTKPNETENNPTKPNETENNPTETQKNLNGNGNGNGAAAAVKHEEFLKNYESPPDIPAQQQQQQQQGFEFHDFSPGEIYSLFRDIDGKLYFDRDYYAQVALFFNTEARTDYETARRYVRELVGAAGKYDNPAGYLYRVVTKPDVWQRFLSKRAADRSAGSAAADTRTADGWTCPACGKKYLAGSVCADCGLTANSDEQDVEVARKRRELSAKEFEAWQQQRREERAERAKKMREEILAGVF